MKLLMFELKKLFGVRYLWVMLALLLAGSAFYYYYLDIGPDSFMASNYDREANELLSDFIRRIETEPEAIEAIRKDYMRYRERAARVSEEIKAGMTDEELVGFRVTEEMLAEHGVTYEDKLGYYRSDGTPVIDGFFFDTQGRERDRSNVRRGCCRGQQQHSIPRAGLRKPRLLCRRSLHGRSRPLKPQCRFRHGCAILRRSFLQAPRPKRPI